MTDYVQQFLRYDAESLTSEGYPSDRCQMLDFQNVGRNFEEITNIRDEPNVPTTSTVSASTSDVANASTSTVVPPPSGGNEVDGTCVGEGLFSYNVGEMERRRSIYLSRLMLKFLQNL